MIAIKISNSDNKKNNLTLKKKLFILSILLIFFYLIRNNKINKYIINKDAPLNQIKFEKNNIPYQKCYLFMDNSNIRIIHFIITRFLLVLFKANGFPEKLYSEDYIPNGIRVMKKYLFPSLENQSCKNFTWILLLGNKANITYVRSLFNFNNSFEKKIIYQKDFKKYLRNVTNGFDVLITTPIDYDDIIYYDAVNDVRKAININKPMLLYGYNRGLIYFEIEDKYCDFYRTYKNEGVMSIFISLIIVLNKVNNTLTVYDLGDHVKIRKTVLKKYKSYGIKELNYEPAIFDSGAPKFIWVRQKYSGSYQNK